MRHMVYLAPKELHYRKKELASETAVNSFFASPHPLRKTEVPFLSIDLSSRYRVRMGAKGLACRRARPGNSWRTKQVGRRYCTEHPDRDTL